jgi:hypothetical protein
MNFNCPLNALGKSPDGRLVVVAGKQLLRVAQVDTHKLLFDLRVHNYINDVIWTSSLG